MSAPTEPASVSTSVPFGRLLPRAVLGGTLMGMANLVPGISGGTMLLAAGVYPQFVGAIAEISRFKLRRDSLLLLGVVIAMALVSIVLLAGPVKSFVVGHRWVAYCLFIGLTLGGVPIVWGIIRGVPGRSGSAVWWGAAGGFIVMAGVAVWQTQSAGGGDRTDAGFLFMFLAGVAGASAMILPGISGGYLLLVLGVYVPILGGIDAVKLALKARDFAALSDPVVDIVIPVGLGVVIGVVLVSNAIKWLLARYELATLGVLLGLLVGAVIGLWPFQRAVKPAVGDVFKGRVLTPETLEALPPSDWPNAFFTPSAGQVLGALGLVVLGFLATHLVARMGKDPA
jgi:putative membrane protein